MIVRGTLPPGARLVESELESQFHVSRTPIRSALNRLVTEGYVVGTGGTKEFLSVAPPSEDDALELFEMVGHLESIAARKAASFDFKTRSGLAARLREYNREIVKAAKAAQPDAARIFDLDVLFHHAFIEAGSGPRLLKHLDALKPQVERYDRLYTSAYSRDMEPSIAEHEKIVSAFRAGEPPLAELAVQRNWRNSADRLAIVIRTIGDKGYWQFARHRTLATSPAAPHKLAYSESRSPRQGGRESQLQG